MSTMTFSFLFDPIKKVHPSPGLFRILSNKKQCNGDVVSALLNVNNIEKQTSTKQMRKNTLMKQISTIALQISNASVVLVNCSLMNSQSSSFPITFHTPSEARTMY